MANAIIIPPLTIVAATGSTSAIGSPINVASDYAGVVWRVAPASSVDLILDLGQDQFFDTALVFGQIDGAFGAQMTVYGSTSAHGASFSSPDYSGPTVPAWAGSTPIAGDRQVSLWTATSTPPAVRHVLLHFDLPNGFLEIARVVLGKRIEMERNFGFGATFGVRDLGSLDFSRRGVMQRARGKKLRTVGLTFSNLRKSEVEGQTKPLLERIGNTEMVGLVTDPSAYAQRQTRCYYGALVGDLGATWRKADLFESKANLVSIF